MPVSDTTISLVAGGGAGLVETIVTYPLDVVKTRQQLDTAPRGTFATLRGIVELNGRRGLFAGITAPLVSEVPRRALKFGANGFYGKLANKYFPTETNSMRNAVAFVCGGLTGATETVIHTPFERVKVRVQGAQGGSIKVTPVWATRQLIAEGGLKSLYRGWEAYALRQFVWNGTFFALIGAAKAEGMCTDPVNNFICGLLSGSIATVVNNPLDVVKTRIQSQSGDASNPKSSPRVAWTIVQEEGFAAMGRGLLARLYRSAPGHGLLFMAFEFFSEKLKAMQ